MSAFRCKSSSICCAVCTLHTVAKKNHEINNLIIIKPCTEFRYYSLEFNLSMFACFDGWHISLNIMRKQKKNQSKPIVSHILQSERKIMIFGDYVVYWFSKQTSVSGVLLIYLVRFFCFNSIRCSIQMNTTYYIDFGTNLRNPNYDFPFV